MTRLLNVKNLTIKFGGLTAVNNVSFHIDSGELVGLIGPNGAGKTTCFNMLTGVYIPTFGGIEFNDESITGIAPHKICQKGLARTFQNIRLFKNMTVLENVLVALHPQKNYSLFSALLNLPHFRKREKALHDEAMTLLESLGLAEMALWEAANLPYGAQRKLEIARALATRPKLLLLDEPAAGMNPSETAALSKFIQELRKKFDLTILLIEHDMSLVMSICRRIYVLDYGELIAEGNPQEIKSNPRVVEAYLGGSLQ